MPNLRHRRTGNKQAATKAATHAAADHTVMGIATAWVTAYLVWFMVWGLGYLPAVPVDFVATAHGLTLLITLWLVVVYAKTINADPGLTKNRKALWILAVVLLSPVSMLSYYLLRLRPRTR